MKNLYGVLKCIVDVALIAALLNSSVIRQMADQAIAFLCFISVNGWGPKSHRRRKFFKHGNYAQNCYLRDRAAMENVLSNVGGDRLCVAQENYSLLTEIYSVRLYGRS